ncbi:sodium-dependent glucose transporter 1A [Galendromus occidentalis]|uniref:Major facilitator superfamily domain-containing protein 4A n=1 Tax=Galendromus occidentalis TaxID=34638 RepID=A0AAJ7L673_9ACAR|nr:sodium-dependent glucose transporter 1A [Galendromus occidentalis]
MDSIADSPKRLRKTHTGVIFGCLFALGLISALVGATYEDLQSIYDMNLGDISRVAVTRSAGILAGFVYQHVNAKIVIIFSLILGGLGTAIVPDAAPHYWLAHVGLFVTGFSVGALEVGCNVWLVQLWGDGVSPMLQSYHVSFGVGALLAPLLAAPFLGPQNIDTANVTELEATFSATGMDVAPQESSHIAIPYAIFGGFYSFMGLVMLFFFMIDRTVLRQHREHPSDGAAERSTLSFEWTVVALLVAFVVVTVTLEGIMSSMLPSFVINDPALRMSKSDASYLLSLYWAFYTGSRMLSMLISTRLKPNTILVLTQSIVAMGVGLLFLMVFPDVAGRWTIWLATAIIGFGISPLYPTAFTWTVRYINLKYAHVSFALVASCTGGFLPTYVVAPWVQSTTKVLPAVSLLCVVLLTCIIYVMLWTTRRRRPISERDGLDSAVPGATYEDLQSIYHMELAEAAEIAVIIGSLLCAGCLYEHVNAKIVIIFFLILSGLGTAIAPDVALQYFIAHAGSFATGLSVGALEIGK